MLEGRQEIDAILVRRRQADAISVIARRFGAQQSCA
jgi:hypothetical protein